MDDLPGFGFGNHFCKQKEGQFHLFWNVLLIITLNDKFYCLLSKFLLGFICHIFQFSGIGQHRIGNIVRTKESGNFQQHAVFF